MSEKHTGRKISSFGRLGIFLSVIGVLLAVDSMVGLSLLPKLWPLLILILGGGFIGIHAARARNEWLFLGVGTYLIGFSGLALYCSFVSWSELATLWPVFIALLGVSLCVGYLFGNRSPVLLLGGLLLLSVAAAFIFVFTVDVKLWWTVFLLTGLSFLCFDRARRTA